MSDLKDQFVSDLDRLLTLEQKFAELKALYGEYDEIVLRLQEQGFTQAEHAGQIFTMKDNFKGTNTSYRVAFVKHYEIKITQPK